MKSSQWSFYLSLVTVGVVEADTEGLMTRGLQRSSLRSQLCNNDICGRCGKILSDKNLSVQKYARLCNAIINVKDCCKRNSGLLFPSSGGFSCDVPDKEYIYEDERLSNGYQKIDNFDCEDDDDEIEFCTNLRQKINEEANICAEVVPNSYREHIFLAIGVICLFVSIVIAFVAGSCYYKHIYKLENERMKEALLNRDNREDESSADLKNYKSIEP